MAVKALHVIQTLLSRIVLDENIQHIQQALANHRLTWSRKVEDKNKTKGMQRETLVNIGNALTRCLTRR